MEGPFCRRQGFAGDGEGVVGPDDGFVGGAHGVESGADGFDAVARVVGRVAGEALEGREGIHVGIELLRVDAGGGGAGHDVSFWRDDDWVCCRLQRRALHARWI